MKKLVKFALIFSFLVGSAESLAIPAWAKASNSLDGKIYRAVCSGTGPSTDTARKDALNSCRLSAREQLVNTIKVRSLTIQTEKSSAFHEEVSEETQYTGLSCAPEREEIEESQGSFKVWLSCKFDLSTATATTIDSSGERVTFKNSSTQGAASYNEVSSRGEHDKPGRQISSEKWLLSLATIPACESILIRGKRPRKVDCDQNPMTFPVDSSDTEIVIRVQGYKPKTIAIAGRGQSGPMQIILDPL